MDLGKTAGHPSRVALRIASPQFMRLNAAAKSLLLSPRSISVNSSTLTKVVADDARVW